MKESHREDLASRSGLEPYADGGDTVGVASGRGDTGQPLSSEIKTLVCRSSSGLEKATSRAPLHGEVSGDAAESKTLCMCRSFKLENRETLWVPRETGRRWPTRGDARKTSQTVQPG